MFSKSDLVGMALVAAKRLTAIVGAEISKAEEESVRKSLEEYLRENPEAGGWRLTIVALNEIGRLRNAKEKDTH